MINRILLGVQVAIRRGTVRLARLAGCREPFSCPACGESVRTFLPLPTYYLKNQKEAGWPYDIEQAETCNAKQYSCPWCDASDRDRLFALFLTEHFGSRPSPLVVVDFAPSSALSRFIRRTIAKRGVGDQYRTADLYMKGVDDRVDITNLSYPSESVDLFLCSHVLEHVPDDRKAMRELRRILKSGGRGALLVPIVLGVDKIDEDPSATDPKERWRRFGQDDHVRLYSKRGFVDRLAEAGFVVSQLNAGHFAESVFAVNGIARPSVLYVVEKS